MKKYGKLSLVAAVAAMGLTAANAADDMGLNVQAGVKSQFFDRKAEGSSSDSIAGVSGYLKVTTKEYKGLTAGAEVQFNTIISDADTTAFNGDMNGEGAILSEGYLQYTTGNTGIKVGRQHIATPILSNSGSRLVKDSFEGVTVVNKDIKNTTLVAGYVSKASTRTDGAGDIGPFEDISTDGGYTLMMKTQVSPALALTAQYVTVQDDAGDKDVLYAQADYKVNETVKVAGQVLSSDNNGVNGTLVGVKADAKMGAINLTAAYTSTGDENVVRGFGHGAVPAFAKLSVGSGIPAYAADTNGYMVKASTNVSGVKVGAGFASYDHTVTNLTETETEISASYKLTANASLAVSHTMFGQDSTKDHETRVTLAYKF